VRQKWKNCEGEILDESKSSFSRAAADPKADLLRCGATAKLSVWDSEESLAPVLAEHFHLN
jgi:hypothetical protein